MAEKKPKKKTWLHIDDPFAFSQRLLRAHLASGLTTRGLTAGICSAPYITHMEKGQRVPSLQILRQLAERLNVNEEWLARGKRPMKRTQAKQLKPQQKKNLAAFGDVTDEERPEMEAKLREIRSR